MIIIAVVLVVCEDDEVGVDDDTGMPVSISPEVEEPPGTGMSVRICAGREVVWRLARCGRCADICATRMDKIAKNRGTLGVVMRAIARVKDRELVTLGWPRLERGLVVP